MTQIENHPDIVCRLPQGYYEKHINILAKYLADYCYVQNTTVGTIEFQETMEVIDLIKKPNVDEIPDEIWTVLKMSGLDKEIRWGHPAWLTD